MNEFYSPESNTARQRKLDALFADQPFLSTTMRASRLHERLDPEPFPPAPFRLQTVSDDTDEVLRRMVEGRACMRPYEHDIDLWSSPMPAVTREAIRPATTAKPIPPVSPAIRHLPRLDKGTEGDRLFFNLVVDLTPDGPKVGRLQTAEAAPDVMTAKEAASYLRVSQTMLRTWTRTLSMPHVRLGRRLRYRRSALLAWLAEWERVD